MKFSIEKNYIKEQKNIINKLNTKLTEKNQEINTLNQKIIDNNKLPNKEIAHKNNLPYQLYIPKVMEDTLKNIDPSLYIEGKLKFITILQIKMDSVNQLHEQLSAKTYVTLYNKIFKQIFSIIYKNYGIITQVYGESLQGVFGLFSNNNSKEAKNALITATEIQLKLNAINDYLKTKKLNTINIGIGIHSGETVIGKMEHSKNGNLFIMGDQAKIAEMVENLSKKYYFSIILSENTKNIVNSDFSFSDVGFLKTPGSKDKLKVYKVN